MKQIHPLLMHICVACTALMLLFSACNQQKAAPVIKDTYFQSSGTGVQSGGVQVIPVRTSKGTYHVWTKRTGNNPRIKVLLLTGGPGLSHEYVECFESFFPKEAIEFIYYDQLGTGASDQPKDASIFNIQESVDELEQVRKALHLDKTNLYLWGHSWGGILAMEYVLKYQHNVKALMVSNMVSSAAVYNNYIQNVLVKQMKPAVVDSLKQFERTGALDDPKYMSLIEQNFYAKYVCRLPEWPEPLTRALGKINTDFYNRMQGKSEFRLDGNLANWSVSSRLSEIKVPALIIGAKYDEMDPEHMKWMASKVSHGKYLYCPNGSHMSMYDDQQVYMNGLINFIKEIDQKQ
jgi:proline iminopeptidase